MKLHHLGYVVRDLERARRGFERDGAIIASPPIDDPIQRVTVQFLREPQSGELWELVAPLGDIEGGPLASRLGRGGGLDHVCYELEAGDGTLEDRVAAEVARGARVVCEPVIAAAFGRRIAFVFRRSQRLIEFVEPRRPGQAL
ncbi:MAG TPA: VOC family protein [Kofleriaceae bacterium]|nr:VOC family protein [Kofleriaceae bacterium]